MAEETPDQIHVQQRAAKVLEKLLARTINEKLPVISWTIASSASQAALTGHCDAGDAEQRRSNFEAWREALTANALSSENATRLHATVTDNYADLDIALIAEI
ncbi:hypothetical protein [Nonomuraea sp. NEAU-A123]|uniref:hypothetical protein n=1 Tax=Nonomuraea sp. NEAU-A123 TaxID=2839649 RepID=UPI001BE43DA0|nr:hypothetical protein [Nonomuraea sp. NEAU-A123]MBT2225995.1 hypothetical protein [Nonomuraea sp. NEAU-A123]